jgi:hypothetical protein
MALVCAVSATGSDGSEDSTEETLDRLVEDAPDDPDNSLARGFAELGAMAFVLMIEDPVAE